MGVAGAAVASASTAWPAACLATTAAHQRPLLRAAHRLCLAYLPREYPPWQTTYTTFRQWRLYGVWQCIHEALRRAVRLGQAATPTPRQR